MRPHVLALCCSVAFGSKRTVFQHSFLLPWCHRCCFWIHVVQAFFCRGMSVCFVVCFSCLCVFGHLSFCLLLKSVFCIMLNPPPRSTNNSLSVGIVSELCCCCQPYRLLLQMRLQAPCYLFQQIRLLRQWFGCLGASYSHHLNDTRECPLAFEFHCPRLIHQHRYTNFLLTISCLECSLRFATVFSALLDTFTLLTFVLTFNQCQPLLT